MQKNNKKFDENDAGASKPFFRRKKTCPFSGPDAITIDFRDTRTLGKFVSETKEYQKEKFSEGKDKIKIPKIKLPK